jgi:glycerophosphoryl diester phosphodiesterase
MPGYRDVGGRFITGSGGVRVAFLRSTSVTLIASPLAKQSFIRVPGAPLRVWAHRGGSSAAPENTAASDEVARRAGVEWIETDVQPTKDGVPVVLHDATVDRTTNGTGAIRSLTAAEVAELDAGSWFSPAYAGQRVPTLASQLDGLRAQGRAHRQDGRANCRRDSLA